MPERSKGVTSEKKILTLGAIKIGNAENGNGGSHSKSPTQTLGYLHRNFSQMHLAMHLRRHLRLEAVVDTAVAVWAAVRELCRCQMI